MSLTIEEFDINELRAKTGKSLYGMKIANFCYEDDFRKVPNIRAYGGMHVMKGKFGEYFELDIKDDETEEFFKSLGEQLKTLAGAYLHEKPWNLKSPIIEYGIFYSIRCKIHSNSKLNGLKVGEYFRGYCDIRPYHAFSVEWGPRGTCGKTTAGRGIAKGITFILNKVLQ